MTKSITIKLEAKKLFLKGGLSGKDIAEYVSKDGEVVSPPTIYAWAKKEQWEKDKKEQWEKYKSVVIADKKQAIRISKEAKAQIDGHARRTGLTTEKLVDHFMGISSDTPKIHNIRKDKVSHNLRNFSVDVRLLIDVQNTSEKEAIEYVRERIELFPYYLLDRNFEVSDTSIKAVSKNGKKHKNLQKLKEEIDELSALIAKLDVPDSSFTQKSSSVSGRTNGTTAKGMVLHKLEEQWQATYQTLIEYKKEYGNIKVLRSTKYHGVNLGEWANTQRKENKKGRLSAKRIKLLEDAGFIWDALTERKKLLEEQWQAIYATLIAYKEEYGNVLVPQNAKYNDLNLGTWVNHQRLFKKSGTLSDEKIKLLEDAGFVWNPHEEQWQEGYRAFVDYRKEHPDVPIPKNAKYHGLNLGIWVQTQRRDYKKGTLSAERIDRLEEAGIVWDPYEEQWQTHYQAFIAYKEENADVLITKNTTYHGLNLGHWVQTQRIMYNKGKLSAERKKLLEDAGIVWHIGRGKNHPKRARITKRKVAQYCLVCEKPSKGKVHPGECHRKHYSIELHCDSCGTPFYKNRREVETNIRVGHKNYCSASCSSEMAALR